MNDLIDRKQAIDALIEWYGCEPNDIDAFKEIIYNKPSAQPDVPDTNVGDMINRQAAIELIKNYCENGCDIAKEKWCPSCQQEQFIELLKDLPSTQSEIVHCRDCKFTDGEKPIADGRYWCVLHSCFMYFCSDAERRTDG